MKLRVFGYGGMSKDLAGLVPLDLDLDFDRYPTRNRSREEDQDGYREDEGLLSRGVMGGHHGHDHDHEHDEHEQPHDPHPHPHPEDLDPSLAPLSRTTTPTSSAHETLVKEHSVLLRLQFLESEVERLKRVEREHDSLRTRMALDRVVMGQSEEGGIEGDAAGTPDGPDVAEGLGFDRE